MKGNNTIFEKKKDIKDYIIGKYAEKYETKISPIKLQKTLYFLFANWGGFARGLNKTDKNELGEKIPEYLFEPNFEAWKYGPVDCDVYSNYKIASMFGYGNYNTTNSLDSIDSKYKSMVIPFIDNIINQAFEISDFSLVDISHRDECWKNSYDKEDQKIDPEDIIAEYENR